MRQSAQWHTEAEMCDAFMDAARAVGWTCYPETGAWDILLVGHPDRIDVRFHGGGALCCSRALPDPFMVGVQAKLRPNITVLAQAVNLGGDGGPHVRAVLVPSASAEFSDVARACRLHVFESRERMYPSRTKWEGLRFIADPLFRATSRLPVLPPFVPDLPAGVPSPVTLSPWKIGAFAVCRVLRAQGFVTRADLKAAGQSPSTWIGRWVMDSGDRLGRMTRYVPMPGSQLPDEMWPKLAKQCAEAA